MLVRESQVLISSVTLKLWQSMRLLKQSAGSHLPECVTQKVCISKQLPREAAGPKTAR